MSEERKYLAVSIKHTEYKWKFGMPCVLWGHRTREDEPRSFGGYTQYPEEAELYSLEEFREKYGGCEWILSACRWMKLDSPVKMEIGFCKKYKKYDTVLVEYGDYLIYCKETNLKTAREV